jgi:glycosyltransferase involved in cell wall biosynthesis
VRPARVLFTIPTLEGGGAERVFVTILRHLDRTRFEPHLALIEAKGVYLADLPSDVPVHTLGGPDPLAYLAFPALVRRLRPDAVLTTLTLHSNLVLLLRPLVPRSVRFVVREVCLPTVHLARRPFGRIRLWLYPPGFRRADAVLCETQDMADDVARAGVPKTLTRVIPNPLDIAAVQARAAEAGSPFGPGRHLVAAGRLVPAKGFDLLLPVFARVAAGRPEVTLHILGTGPDGPALERQARDLGIGERVVFEGFRDNPFPYFRHADVFVLPSRYEGFPNVVLEALALGTPVLAFACPGGTAVVDGENGWVAPAGDVEALGLRLGAALDGSLPPRSRVAASVARHGVDQVLPAIEAALAPEGPR